MGSSSYSRIVEGEQYDESNFANCRRGCGVFTMEIEHVGVKGKAKVEKEVVSLQASSRVIKIIQDTYAQCARDKLCEGETITERCD